MHETIRPVAIGDTFVLDLSGFPDAIDEDAWNDAQFRLYGPLGEAANMVNADSSLTADFAKQEIKIRYATTGGEVRAGSWRWNVGLTSTDNSYSMTAFEGVVIFQARERESRITHDADMIALLEQVIADRLAADGRRDILSYAIGDRNLSVEPLSALRKELDLLRERVAYGKGRRLLRA